MLLSIATRFSFSCCLQLICKSITNLAYCFLFGWIISTLGKFAYNIKDLSIMLSLDRCHRLQPLMAISLLLQKENVSKNFFFRDHFTILCLQMQTPLVYSSYTWHFNNYFQNSFPIWSQIKMLQLFRAISELRNLEVLNLAMCTGVTITGMCSLVKGGKHHR